MPTWAEFASSRPDLAEAGRDLFYQVGVGLGFLATIRTDGGPRVHPMCPLLDDNGMYAFIVPSPKQRDLRRDGRYALHSFPCDDNEDAFCATGTARLVDDPAVRADLSGLFVSERALHRRRGAVRGRRALRTSRRLLPVDEDNRARRPGAAAHGMAHRLRRRENTTEWAERGTRAGSD